MGFKLQEDQQAAEMTGVRVKNDPHMHSGGDSNHHLNHQPPLEK